MCTVCIHVHAWYYDIAPCGHGAFAIWPAGQTTCWCHWWVSKKLLSLEPRQSKKVTLVGQSTLLTSSSYSMPFVIVSRTTGVFFVKIEPSHQSSWQANNAIYLRNETFSVKSTQYKSLKKLYATSLGPTNQVHVYIATSAVTETHTQIHTQNDYNNPHACA